ncbi:MAG: 50S ribosomal protein L22 [Myxococcales bacterium]|nr:50S ribosomal protein L22 [Myxococcales bacterium]
MKVRAQARFVRQSPQKVRAVLDVVRGLPATEALQVLQFSERRAATPVRKVVQSALANADNNFGFDADELFLSECYADEGPTLKRWRPRARGRATPIHKRTSHITVVVSDGNEE